MVNPNWCCYLMHEFNYHPYAKACLKVYSFSLSSRTRNFHHLTSQFLRAETSKLQLFTSPTAKNTHQSPRPQQYAPHQDEKHRH
jgi:hypothetical protein